LLDFPTDGLIAGANGDSPPAPRPLTMHRFQPHPGPRAGRVLCALRYQPGTARGRPSDPPGCPRRM